MGSPSHGIDPFFIDGLLIDDYGIEYIPNQEQPMPNTYPQNPAKIAMTRLKARRASAASSSGLSRHQARVSRKAATVLKLQDRTANQLFRLAAISGALSKKARNKNNSAVAGVAQAVSSTAAHLAKQMWQEYNTIATDALRILGGSAPKAQVRSAVVGIAAKAARTGPTKSKRPKGPVNIVNPSNLANLMSRLNTLQKELSGFTAKTGR
jgi:hypothetical protein